MKIVLCKITIATTNKQRNQVNYSLINQTIYKKNRKKKLFDQEDTSGTKTKHTTNNLIMDHISFTENSTASYEDLLLNGPPSPPLQFGTPRTGRAERVDAPVLNPITQEILEVSNIIYERHVDDRPPDRAYWVGRKLKKCIFGVVKECTLLKFRNDTNVPWEVTSGKAAVKIMSWQKIRDLQHIEDPIKEVAAMQYVSSVFGQSHPHVMGVLDVLQDEDYLLLFMPYCSSGDLFGFVQQAGKFPEPMARYWFRQILQGIAHLQRVGICHRDMSLENILVDDYKTSVIIDLGMCIRVPFSDYETGDVCDVSHKTLRRLISPLIPCGKPNYISPEVLKSEEPFDGFAIDLWAAAVILFIMLVGLPPWEFAREEDPRYRTIIKGGLERMLLQWQRPISPLAADLLQRMLQESPSDRLSLNQIMNHPWIVFEDDNSITTDTPYYSTATSAATGTGTAASMNGSRNGSSVPSAVAGGGMFPARNEPWRG